MITRDGRLGIERTMSTEGRQVRKKKEESVRRSIWWEEEKKYV